MEHLLREGIISGWEKYADSQEEALVYGVENDTLYQANFKQLYQNINYYDFMLELASKVKKIMQSVAEVLYPDYLRYLENQRLLYESGALSFEDWVSILLKAKHKANLKFHTPNLRLIEKMAHLKQNLNFELLYLEVHDFIKSLLPYLQKAEKDSLKKLKAQNIAEYYRFLGKLLNEKNIRIQAEYAEFTQYLKFLELKSKLNFFMLTEESSELLYKLKKQDQVGATQDLIYCERYLDLMVRYARNETTEREEENFYARLLKLSLELSVENYLTLNENNLHKTISGMQKFYTFVNQRNRVMVNNLLKGMSEKGKDDAVLIVGGYHTRRIKDILRAKGISYKEILVQTANDAKSSIVSKEIYLKRLKKQGESSGFTALQSTPNVLMNLAYLAISMVPSDQIRGEVIAIIKKMYARNELNTGDLEKLTKHDYYDQLKDILNIESVEGKIKNKVLEAVAQLFDIPSNILKKFNTSIIGKKIEETGSEFEALLNPLNISAASLAKNDQALLKNKKVMVPQRRILFKQKDFKTSASFSILKSENIITANNKLASNLNTINLIKKIADLQHKYNLELYELTEIKKVLLEKISLEEYAKLKLEEVKG
ncbi:MAG: hypothetical protein GY817_08465, partial [bacterium]|nr:hypothetical protein [bacterium]